MHEPKRTILGFDYGLISIGVAVGQELTSSAKPLTSLTAYQGIPHWDDIKLLIKQWNIQLLVVGLPLNMDGTEQAMTVAAQRFGNQLNGRFHLPIAWQDERLSTYEAMKQLGINNKSQEKHQGDVDQISAQLILQSWFNQ
ncbi:MAG: Holliday junction resolvase RuvX [Piscirickettsiaceae bacterium]|nr:Holliday junction resolvase RuvX [Piscirickettsiaceae bacterium]